MQAEFGARGDFLKAAGAQLLTALPTDVRMALHHAEVAAIIEPFTPPPWMQNETGNCCCVQRSYYVVAVTESSVLLLAPHLPASRSSSSAPRIVLKLPLMLLKDVVRQVELEAHMQRAASAIVQPLRADVV